MKPVFFLVRLSFSFLFLFLLTGNAFSKEELPPHVKKYLSQAADEIELLSVDIRETGFTAWREYKDGNVLLAYQLAKRWAGDRDRDPFLAYFFEQIETTTMKDMQALPVRFDVWFNTINSSGAGTDDSPFQVPSVRVAQLFLLTQDAEPLELILEPRVADGAYSNSGFSSIEKLLLWVRFRDPTSKEMLWVAFEVDSYALKTLIGDGDKRPRETLAKIFNDCVSAEILPCQLGYAWSKQKHRRHSWALRDYLRLAPKSAFAALSAGDNFAGFHFMRRNLPMAEHYWKMAVDLGSVQGLSRLGRLYGGLIADDFQRKDLAQAQALFRDAIAKGDRAAGRHLIELSEAVPEIEISEDEKQNFLQAAASSDDIVDTSALVQYANFLFKTGSQENIRSACSFLKRAIREDGDITADFSLHVTCENIADRTEAH